MAQEPHTYDVAVSFSGRQRDYVEKVVQACQALGVRVFYDKDETARLWGTNVVSQLRKVYGGVATRFVVPFLSRDYVAGPYPMDEFYAAMTADVNRGGGYILPVLMDDVQMPEELLNPAIVYLRAEENTPEQLAQVIANKVDVARTQRREPREISSVVEATRRLRMPKTAPIAFNAQESLDAALARVGELFKTESARLLEYGLTCRVRTTDTSVTVLVEERGNPVCELALREGDTLWTGQLTMAFAWPRITGTGTNGSVTAKWDSGSATPVLVLNDFSRPGSVDEPLRDADELFTQLWEKVIWHIDHRAR